MRKWLLLTVSILLITAMTVIGVGLRRRGPHAEGRAEATAPLRATPADRYVESAEALIKRQPNDARGYNQLCAAYLQKARETGDFIYYARAEAAVRRSLELNPRTDKDNYDALRMQAALMLSYHRFDDALKLARRMEQIRPDDHYLYGVMTDSLVELGDYKAAVEAADKMTELRPDAASYSRISYLRALHGYDEQAIEAMKMAVRASSPRDAEGHAWFRVHLGDELMNAGRREEAMREYDAALEVFPNYHFALAAKGRAAAAAGDWQQAIEFYQRAQELVPTPDGAIALGDLYTKLGRTDEARRQYEKFETLAGASGGTYAVKRAVFMADHDTRLDEAVELARRERAARSDIYTCDALAWTLFKKGRHQEAASAITEAMRIGTKDARIFYHAGMIYHALGDEARAAKYLQQALGINSGFDLLQADVAKQALAQIGKK